MIVCFSLLGCGTSEKPHAQLENSGSRGPATEGAASTCMPAAAGRRCSLPMTLRTRLRCAKAVVSCTRSSRGDCKTCLAIRSGVGGDDFSAHSQFRRGFYYGMASVGFVPRAKFAGPFSSCQ